MHSRIALLTLAASTANLAAASVKRVAASYEDTFTRPQETGVMVDNFVVQEYSPVVTEAPVFPRYGLVARQNTFGRGPDTCAFFPDGFPLRCYSRDATCIYASPWAGCCLGSESCTSIPTTCIDYTDVLKGSCDPNKVTDPKTACCDREVPNCIRHSIDMGGSRVSIWGCSAGTAAALLLTTNPALAPDGETTGSLTRTGDVNSDLGATPITPSPKSTNTDDTTTGDDEGSSTNVGAIAGGAVGGVGGLALIGAAIFFFMRHKKKEKAASAAAAPAPAPMPMAQQPPGQSPPPNNAYAYNNSQPAYNQQHYGAYDPKAYPQQEQGSPGPYSPSAYSPGYGQPQQPSWGYPSPTGTNVSPGPISTGSPVAGTEATAAELPENKPTGTTENRAELG